MEPMSLITLISSMEMDSQLQMSFVKTAVTEGYDATLLHMLTHIQEAQARMQQMEAQLEAERKKNDALQKKLDKAEATLHTQSIILEAAKQFEADLPYEELEDRLRIIQALESRESRQHRKTKQQLVAAKQQIAILGSLE